MRVLHLTVKESSPAYRHQIRALEERGIECTTLTVPGGGEFGGSRSVLDYLRLYPAVLKRSYGRYDVVHANYGLTAPVALAQPNLPVVQSLWGTDLDGEYGWVSRRCADYCDATVVMSERMRADLGRDCRVVPHGIDAEHFAPRPRSEAIAEVGWDPDVRHVIFPYRPEREVKNYPRAERVFEAAADELSIPTRFHAITDAAHDEMPTIMNAADCLLLTSDREGSPNTVKEALACDLPVVATDVGDVRERLDGVDPSTVCESDAELRAALVSVLRRGERSNGRDRVDEISRRRMAKRLHEVYRSVCDEAVDAGDAASGDRGEPNANRPEEVGATR